MVLSTDPVGAVGVAGTVVGGCVVGGVVTRLGGGGGAKYAVHGRPSPLVSIPEVSVSGGLASIHFCASA